MITKTESVPHSPESLSHWVPETEADREAVREHLKSILATHYFKTSKRYPALLNHIVEVSLEGRPEALKERTLGIEVFHRDPMYDTSSDPVVRTAACEVRKRLGQYYSEFAREEGIRIELPPGSYVPEFRHRNLEHGNGNSTLDSADKKPLADAIHSPSVRLPIGLRFGYLGLIITLAIGVTVGAAGTKLHLRPGSTAIEEFWRPLLTSPEAALICMGELYTPQIDLEPNGSRNRFNLPVAWTGPPRPSVSYSVASLRDSIALASLAAWLRGQRKPYVIEGDSTTTFSALSRGPVVLVGAFNNDWTIRLTDQWRYHFDMDPNTNEAWIADRDRPSQKLGLHVHGMAVSRSEEYSLVSRVHDPATDHTVLALAGVAGGATSAAVEFVTNQTELEAFAKQAPAGWQNRNLQVVIAVGVVDGSLGPPRIVATYVW